VTGPCELCQGGVIRPADGNHDVHQAVERARAIVERSRRIAVLTGAGISTESGIPDFRGPQGVWTKNPGAERLATIEAYLSDPSTRVAAWRSRLDAPAWKARPNAGHLALVELERRGVLHTLVTQNIDGLHLAAGHDPGRVVEIHGTMHETVCLRCGHRMPTLAVLERVRAGDADPSCTEPSDGGRCGGILKSATVSFGQRLDPDQLWRAESAARECDLLLAVGSTLSVYPAAGMVPLAAEAGARIVIVNAEPTEYDHLADVVVRGAIGVCLPTIVGTGATGTSCED